MKHQQRRPGRRLGAVLALALAAACVAAGADAAARATSGSTALAGDTTQPARAGRLFVLRSAAAFWGGTYTANTGEPVQIEVSDAYPQDPALPQRWADYLAPLAHGDELASLTAYLAPFDEVQSICGDDALACYSSQAQTLVAPANPAADLTTEAIVAHEYGHHVAANRLNPPWRAIDYGTKRWATAVMNVCAKASSGDLHPGAEDADRYALNPGEGFAEAYRVFNQQRLGQPLLAWQIVSPTLFPDAAALQAIEQDVHTPWTRPTSSRRAGSLAARRARTSTIETPLDGTARVALRVFGGAVTADVLAGGKRLARLSVSAGRAASTSVTVCGQRSLRLRLSAGRRASTYTTTVSRP